MFVKEPKEIIDEIRLLQASRGDIIRSLVDGRLHFYKSTFRSDQEFEQDKLTWVLRAHSGTLDKLDQLVTNDGPYDTFQLLASARNLFENLIWIRLFRHNFEYGHVFYEMLILQQIDSLERNIVQVQAEIELFEECDQKDQTITAQLIAEAENALSEEAQTAMMRSQQRQRDELDRQVRRSFTLYGAAAKFNGYGYQIHLLRTKALPKLEQTLAECQRAHSAFQQFKASSLNRQLTNAASHWNWRDRARDVGMLHQYDFLYRYTSRLLHSTPMNLITEKSLSESERLLMLDYLFVTVSDIYDEIEEFEAPGVVDVFLVRTDAGQSEE
ncbi:hypothetical protein ELG79_09110 [Rhizobium leguminosarum]|uniref:hypothetical protein n=1 Tax=Rhizobium leguminosarum TaxID=384 RepID=UPI001031092C|nr:hypothetical protein [Rhizobium leguminosarum]TBG25400.1 hypothetical protein ELG79_09110 [Rhizobium leguminosarum]